MNELFDLIIDEEDVSIKLGRYFIFSQSPDLSNNVYFQENHSLVNNFIGPPKKIQKINKWSPLAHYGIEWLVF